MNFRLMETFKNYLKQFPHYTPKVLDTILPYLSIQNIEAGDYFLKQGKICRHIGFIDRGLLRLYYLNDGKEVTTCFCKENTITCSYKSLITHTPSDVSIQALEPSELIVFSYQSLQQLYEKDLFWQQVGRLAAESEYITNECHHRFISDLSATERYQQILEEDNDLLQRVSLNFLASYLQVAPETLSRIRKRISDKG